MPSLNVGSETFASRTQDAPSAITRLAAAICLVWYIAVAVVCTVGYVQLRRYYSSPPPAAVLRETPDVTIIRPVKGIEPGLYECLASTLRQSYLRDRLHIRFCISSRSDPALPTLTQLLHDFPGHDVTILIEDEDQLLQQGQLRLGPNPKIRNMSRAYREAQGDIVWIIDCNVWVGTNTCERMVERLQTNKFIHLLPLVVDTTLLDSGSPSWKTLGGRLEEMFLSSSHAKFYTAINTVLIAPCIIGKSTMFRRSHLNSLTENQGIDYFSYNICEDHLIGDLLWKRKVPAEENGQRLGKHALCFGDLAIQPVTGMSGTEYWNRRVRWLRVRKFTVMLATFVEPGTESFLCSMYGAFAATTLPFFHQYLHIPQTWSAFAVFWLLSVSIWCTMDRRLYNLLHSGASIRLDENTPTFARSLRSVQGKAFSEWFVAWLGREALALPIWFWAFWGGTTVEWRGKKFWVGVDMKVHEIRDDGPVDAVGTSSMNGHGFNSDNHKARVD
ncbi:nucleotide-diphospho-sugar transferase [Neohortaea acidophila]|uniref:Ceramide glucosyltransferase n=1 Tax=Neohortaea acidophila TaxID=245834 RepID=A0A6A6PTA5_9PEZI|nr:nucleotide-diphospho-sugar transferase [Neohortaea acidophila]KAF2483339.1 nucleotide-diphospho-sugar transferase [Neohortaea acidophila]